MKKYLSILAVLGLLPLAAAAQGQNTGKTFSHAIDFSFGCSIQPYSWAGDACTAKGASIGSDISLRYTCFFSEHWGAFLNIGAMDANSYDAEFFGVVNKADGGKYLYRFNSGYSYSMEFPFMLSAGAAYRMYAGPFTFIPRAGIGVTTLDVRDFSYERRSRDGSKGPEYYNYGITGKEGGVDYLIDANEGYILPSPLIITADLQIAYRSDRRVYGFIQPGLVWAMGKYTMGHDHTASVKKYAPSNWVEAVAYRDATDQWMVDESSKEAFSEDRKYAPIFSINIGIGVNLGRLSNRR